MNTAPITANYPHLTALGVPVLEHPSGSFFYVPRVALTEALKQQGLKVATRFHAAFGIQTTVPEGFFPDDVERALRRALSSEWVPPADFD